MDWSNDGRFLLYNVIDPKQGADIWALPLVGGSKPFEVLRTDSNELLPQFSPDGKWMAYQSDKTGRFEILEAIGDPEHGQHEQMRDWLGDDFDPEAFSVDEVNRRLAPLHRHRSKG